MLIAVFGVALPVAVLLSDLTARTVLPASLLPSPVRSRIERRNQSVAAWFSSKGFASVVHAGSDVPVARLFDVTPTDTADTASAGVAAGTATGPLVQPMPGTPAPAAAPFPVSAERVPSGVPTLTTKEMP
ncbi:hypothetical protein [Kitasatospora sp. NBC_01539]|uniref:hypothetical protein n=1 Tax=Kitasatospora sp. NBC_01539 TaxID=2903577 RepID=UPI00386010FA